MSTNDTHAVRAEIDSPIHGTRWALIDHGDHAGLLVCFDAHLVPDVVAHLAQLEALADPQLARPVAHGVFGRQAWVIYEGTLDESLEELAGPLSSNELLQLADGLMAALERAHEHGFVHPGISSALVRMHATFDGRLSPELLGLGLPSLVARSPHDDLADVAALLYRLYTGQDAFAPGAPRAGSLPPTFAEARPGGSPPAHLESVIMRALGPRERAFGSAKEMRAALPKPALTRTRSGLRVHAGTTPHPPRAVRDSGIAGPGQSVVPASFPTDVSERVAEPAGPARKPWWLVLVLLVGGGVAWFVMGTAETPISAAVAVARPEVVAAEPSWVAAGQPAPISARQPAAVVAEVVAPRASPEVVSPEVLAEVASPEVLAEVQVEATTFVLTSEPDDALVTVNGIERGRTPLDLELKAADLPATIVFARRGHVAITKTIDSLTEPNALAVKLRASAARTERREQDAPKSPSASPILLGR